MLLSVSTIGRNYVDTDWLVVALVSPAFFDKGRPTCTARIVGNVVGIVTPIVIGYIIAETHSLDGALCTSADTVW